MALFCCYVGIWLSCRRYDSMNIQGLCLAAVVLIHQSSKQLCSHVLGGTIVVVVTR